MFKDNSQQNTSSLTTTSSLEQPTETLETTTEETNETPETTATIPNTTRPQRNRRPPTRFSDYILEHGEMNEPMHNEITAMAFAAKRGIQIAYTCTKQ